MLKKYEFQITDWGKKDRVFEVNEHKVSSGVFSMLYYKVLNNDSYKVDYKMKHEFSKDDYFHKQINTTFVPKEV